jgi:hypothetical protein
MNLCSSDNEEREYGVGVGVNSTMLLETLQFVGFGEAAVVSVVYLVYP